MKFILFNLILLSSRLLLAPTLRRQVTPDPKEIYLPSVSKQTQTDVLNIGEYPIWFSLGLIRHLKKIESLHGEMREKGLI